MYLHYSLTSGCAPIASVVNTARKCLPVQHEAAFHGQVVQDDEGQVIVYELVGFSAADYSANKEVVIQSVFSEGALIANHTHIRTSVSY